VRLIKRIILFLVLLCVLLVGILFAIHNTTPVTIDLIFLTLPQASLSLWLLGAFVIGGVLGVVLSSFIIFSLKAKIHFLKRNIQSAKSELDKLKTSGVKDLV